MRRAAPPARRRLRRLIRMFSLLEVVVVLIIVTVVALLAAPQLLGPLTRSETETARLQAEQAVRTASTSASLAGGSGALTRPDPESPAGVGYTVGAADALTAALGAVPAASAAVPPGGETS